MGHAPEASVAQADDAARAAQEAFPAWAATPGGGARRAAPEAAKRLGELGADLVPLIISETGATATVGSRMQVPVAIERFERYARDAGPRTSGSRSRRSRCRPRRWRPARSWART